ncbi:RHS repeat-associated core domain-containing protein [Frankia sp. Cr2]|uniref:RHS repeat-associated core domain-containing protein n=1 Tax=Frankia sp. Cr2 TaxID=3073932 RepID=UPI002AD3D713|nr:RHS repeat-associated core domain-containing protein [Frankia sp. Cr2]
MVTDLVGTPTELLDPAGELSWKARTTLWGAGPPSSSAGGGVDCPLRFPGQYHDPETGANYNVHRYYDPETARYDSTDPLGLGGGLDPSAYVHNPLYSIDPLGLVPYSPEEKGRLARLARGKVRRGQGPDEIDRIDPPNTSVTGSQWHAQRRGKGSPGLNQDGSLHDGDPQFSRKTLKWLREHGWDS